jgi:RNA polymerase sigma factor (sigma-70 family)
MLSEDTAVRAARPPAAQNVGARVGRLYDEHARMVMGICRVLLRDPHEAEDAAQQTFLLAHRALLGGTEPRDSAAWLATIARNECRGRIRTRMATPASEPFADDHPELSVAGVDETAERRDLVRALRAALAELPERQRQAIVLREFYGLRQDELAAALEVEEPSVESLLWRARRSLAKRNVATDVGAAILLVPPTLREQLARLIPGFGETAVGVGAAGAGIPVAAKLAAAAAAVVTAASVGGDRPERRPLPVAAQPAIAAPIEVEDRSGPSERSGQGQGRGRGRGTDEARSDSSGPGSGEVEAVEVRDDNSGSGSVDSGSGSVNSGSGSRNSGRGSDNSGSGSDD